MTHPNAYISQTISNPVGLDLTTPLASILGGVDPVLLNIRMPSLSDVITMTPQADTGPSTESTVCSAAVGEVTGTSPVIAVAPQADTGPSTECTVCSAAVGEVTGTSPVIAVAPQADTGPSTESTVCSTAVGEVWLVTSHRSDDSCWW